MTLETAQAIASLEERVEFLETNIERAFECITRLTGVIEEFEANIRRSFDALKPLREDVSPYDLEGMQRARKKRG